MRVLSTKPHRPRLPAEAIKALAEQGLKRCPNCMQNLPFKSFGTNGASLNSNCKECLRTPTKRRCLAGLEFQQVVIEQAVRPNESTVRLTDRQIDDWKAVPSVLMPEELKTYRRGIRSVQKRLKIGEQRYVIANCMIATEAAHETFKPHPRPGVIGDLLFHLSENGRLPPEEYKRQWEEHLIEFAKPTLLRIVEENRGRESEIVFDPFEII